MDIFNEKLALEKVDGNRALMLELFAMMVSELPKNMAQLESALQIGNKEECWNIAHKITGATAYCGVPSLQSSARALENSIRKDLNDVATRFTSVQKDVLAVIHYHQEHLL